MTKYTDDNSNFGANGPFFHIIRQGLDGLADGEDYFDLLADDVVFDYVISVPGYPRHVILEYQVHGKSVQTGRPCHNHFVSIITIENQKSPAGATTSTPSPSSRQTGGPSDGDPSPI